jgi:hypothetical protein
MKLITLLFVLIQLILFSCKKDDDTSLFEGVVIDNLIYTPVPYANVDLMIAEGRYFSPSQPLINPVYYHTVCDADGKFRFAVASEKKNIYSLMAWKTDYASVGGGDMALTNSVNYDTIYLEKLTVLKIIFNDTVSTSLNDSLQIMARFTHNAPYFYTDSYHSGIIGSGATISFYDNIPNVYTNAEINWKVLNNGVLADVDTTVTLIPSDTTTINIFY